MQDVSPHLPCIEVWCPWFNEVGVTESEVSGCDDGVGSDGGLRRLFQHSEQQLQILVTQRGARRGEGGQQIIHMYAS